MKILLTATVQSHICQFHRPLVEMLHSKGYEVHVAARDNLSEKNGLKLDFAERVFNVPFARSPKSADNITAYKQLKKIIAEGQYDIIHCNTPMGGVVTRLAARKVRKNGTKIFYTAHGFHFYEGAPKKNWMVYYPIEKIFANRFTDKLIVISDADYNTAKERGFKLPLYRIHSVGINSGKYYQRTEEEICSLRKAHGFSESDFICICTGELNKNKNQKRLISAVPEILKNVPDFKLLLAGNGAEDGNLASLISELNLDNCVKLIGYRTDLENYVAISDIAASMSIREGLGINLIEAMACGKPVIGSDNRGHREFISNGENGYIIKSDNDIVEYIRALANSKELKVKMGNKAKEDASIYMDKNVFKELEKIYFGSN